jgi:MerR family copper efflux transcriptional regulator
VARGRSRSSRQVKALASRHLEDVDAKIAELQAMRDTLNDLLERCHGDARPDCPILADLAGHGDASETTADKID